MSSVLLSEMSRSEAPPPADMVGGLGGITRTLELTWPSVAALLQVHAAQCQSLCRQAFRLGYRCSAVDFGRILRGTGLLDEQRSQFDRCGGSRGRSPLLVGDADDSARRVERLRRASGLRPGRVCRAALLASSKGCDQAMLV